MWGVPRDIGSELHGISQLRWTGLLTVCTAAPSRTRPSGEGMFGAYTDAILPGLNLVEGGQSSTGSVISWYSRLLGSPSLRELDDAAAAIPPGANGLLALDHFQGNRTPHTDPLSRGAILGLTLMHTRCVPRRAPMAVSGGVLLPVSPRPLHPVARAPERVLGAEERREGTNDDCRTCMQRHAWSTARTVHSHSPPPPQGAHPPGVTGERVLRDGVDTGDHGPTRVSPHDRPRSRWAHQVGALDADARRRQ